MPSTDKEKRPRRVKSDRSKQRKQQIVKVETPTVATPPPPYSAADPNSTAIATAGAQAAFNAFPTNAVASWTRHFISQTDESFICLTSDGSRVFYSKGKGRASSTPHSATEQRKYFCSDGSSILLSREGWIEYNNGAGAKRTMSANDLRWHTYANRDGWFAYAPPPPTAVTRNQMVTVVPVRTTHVRHDSGQVTRHHSQSTSENDSGSETGEDDYDDMYKYSGMLRTS